MLKSIKHEQYPCERPKSYTGFTMGRHIRLILHNIRSTYNVGAIFRLADGLAIEHIYLSGYTPYPAKLKSDKRLPHLAAKLDRQIHKTALGAEKSVIWTAVTDPQLILKKLQAANFKVIALEQTAQAKDLTKFRPPGRLVLLVGNEVKGLPNDLLTVVDHQLQIPMFGAKESFNVATATAMALYQLRFAAD